jgi:hypothetical protein
MPKLTGGRPQFKEWVDKQPDPKWPLMPLTHITRGIGAQDIVSANEVGVTECTVFGEPLAYFFYGRPAYRIGGDGAVRIEAACPYCFIFNADLIDKAKAIFAFDTGAFAKRLYKHILVDEMQIEDFLLEKNKLRLNQIISTVFGSREAYFDGDLSKIPDPDTITKSWEFQARAYLHLLTSPGRNEPDDRICSIEIVFGEKLPLSGGNLLAIVVPHTLWDGDTKAPWLEKLQGQGVAIAPYLFIPGKPPEYYHALLEAAVRTLYKGWGAI